MGTDTPGHTLFLECCITNGYTGRWGFTPAHVQCRQIWARRVYASHLCAKHKTSLPSPHLLPITPSLKKEVEKRKKLIQKRMKCSFFFGVSAMRRKLLNLGGSVQVCFSSVCVCVWTFPGWRTARTKRKGTFNLLLLDCRADGVCVQHRQMEEPAAGWVFLLTLELSQRIDSPHLRSSACLPTSLSFCLLLAPLACN